MTKKISFKDWNRVTKWNPAARWLRPFCSYSLTEISDGFRLDCKIGWFMYLILFLPVHLLQLFVCMWDGGLKEFEVEGRHIGHEYIINDGINCECYLTAKEVWERH